MATDTIILIARQYELLQLAYCAFGRQAIHDECCSKYVLLLRIGFLVNVNSAIYSTKR